MFKMSFIPVTLILSGISFAIDVSALRATPSSNIVVSGVNTKQSPSIVLDKVYGHNLTAVVVGAKELNNNTIQVVLEANIPPASTGVNPSLLPVSDHSQEKQRDRLNVELIYGAGDQDSITLLKSPDFLSFFTRPDILNKTSFELTPYGRATEINVNTLSAGFLFWHPELRRGNITRVYRCPNGESECESNLIHSCAVKVSQNDPSVYLPFVGCMTNATRGTSPEDSSFACSNSTIFMENLKECALGHDGIELQHRSARAANKAPSIPAFYIDNQFHPFNVTSVKDIRSIFCDVLFGQGIMDRDICDGNKEANKLSAPFESLLTAAVVKSPIQ
jgi:hypothetical protein